MNPFMEKCSSNHLERTISLPESYNEITTFNPDKMLLFDDGISEAAIAKHLNFSVCLYTEAWQRDLRVWLKGLCKGPRKKREQYTGL